MENKIVSFKVAKAIKEAGHPQDIQQELYGYSLNSFSYYDAPYDYDALYNYHCTRPGEMIYFDLMCRFEEGCEYCVAPSYLDVWLWLWREKGIHILTTGGIVFVGENKLDSKNLYNCPNDPEEIVIAAIEYLVDNDLIK